MNTPPLVKTHVTGQPDVKAEEWKNDEGQEDAKRTSKKIKVQCGIRNLQIMPNG